MLAAGSLLLSGEAASTGEAMRRAGYAESTSRNPRLNGAAPERLISEALKARGEKPATLRRIKSKAVKRLDSLLDDEDPRVAGPVALGVVKAANEETEEEPLGAGESHRAKANLLLLGAMERGLRVAQRWPLRVDSFLRAIEQRRRELTAPKPVDDWAGGNR